MVFFPLANGHCAYCPYSWVWHRNLTSWIPFSVLFSLLCMHVDLRIHFTYLMKPTKSSTSSNPWRRCKSPLFICWFVESEAPKVCAFLTFVAWDWGAGCCSAMEFMPTVSRDKCKDIPFQLHIPKFSFPSSNSPRVPSDNILGAGSAILWTLKEQQWNLFFHWDPLSWY